MCLCDSMFMTFTCIKERDSYLRQLTKGVTGAAAVARAWEDLKRTKGVLKTALYSLVASIEGEQVRFSEPSRTGGRAGVLAVSLRGLPAPHSF